MDVESALAQPRFHHQWKPDELKIERKIGNAVLRDLERSRTSYLSIVVNETTNLHLLEKIMFKHLLLKFSSQLRRRPRSRSQSRRLSAAVLETLEQRRLLTVTASLDTSTHLLTVTGDTAANSIALQTSSGTLSVTDYGISRGSFAR